MMYWIYDYPSWEIGLLFCAVFLAVTWIGIFLTRATIHSWVHQDGRTNEMVGIALSSFFVLFGLLLGLLAVATYQNYSTVGDIVDREASSMAALYRDFSGYPQPIRRQLQNQLRDDARFTIDDDWPQMQRGTTPTGSTERINAIGQTLLAFEPGKESEKIIHAEAFRQFNNLIEVRRSRLANVKTGLPPVLWWVVVFGAVLNIMLIWMQDMERHVHLILGGVLASILGAVIFLIAELGNPFRGEVSIGPDSIELAYKTEMKAETPATLPQSTLLRPQTTASMPQQALGYADACSGGGPSSAALFQG
jgi:hypothetical protein